MVSTYREENPASAPSRSRVGRFGTARVLKRAGGITSYAGEDLETKAPVVIKTVPVQAYGRSARARLEYDVAALNRLRSRQITVGVDEDLLYFARPFVRGTPLAKRLRSGPMDPMDVVDLGIAVVSELRAAHAHGVLHRGIKPSNIIIGDDGRARLVDLAFNRSPRTTTVTDPSSLRDARYLSPEHAGALDAPIDARADLYAFGVALYEALAGHPPFDGATVGEILRKHLVSRPAPVDAAGSPIALGLRRVVDALLRKDPRDRYQTAAGVLADLEEVRVSRDPESIVCGANDVRRRLSEPAFVGRREEIAVLRCALDRVREGEGGLALIEAESGRGKTRLLAEVRWLATSLGARVLDGYGANRVPESPYHVLVGVARELASRAHSEPEWGIAIAARLGEWGAVARVSIPELAAVIPALPSTSLGPEAHGEARTTAALTAFIDALGAPGSPCVLLLDDAQWIDDSTMRLLEHWQSARPPDRSRDVLVVLAFRPEDLPEHHALTTLQPMEHVRLAELTPAEVREQIASMAGRLPGAAVETTLRHAGGNPFLVSAMLHGMVEVGALQPGPEGWFLDADRLSEIDAPERAASILTLRLGKLAERSRMLLAVAAVLGRTFDPLLAAGLAGVDPQDAIESAEAVSGTLLWAGGSGVSYTFIHDKIREALLEHLSDDQRKSLHRSAAQLIEADDPHRVHELAYHFDAAGDSARALPFAMEAAERARAQFALELAERYYRIAARAAIGSAAELGAQKGLGDVLALRNCYDEADACYRRALGVAGTNRQRAEVQRRWSQLEMKRGDMRSACAHAEDALRLLGHRIPTSKLELGARTIWETMVQVAHTALPALVRARDVADDDDELFAIDIYHALNGPYFFSRDVMWAGWAHLRLINLAEHHPRSRALGRAYAAHAVALNAFPRLFARGLRISKRGAELCERLGDPWGQAQGLTFHAMMLYYLGRFDESIETGRRASALFDRTGDRWEANSGLDFAVDALVRKGDLRAAVRLAREIWDRGLAIDDSHALAWSLDAWSRATDGKIDVERVEFARSRARDLQTALAVAQADGVRLIGAGKLEQAVEVLDAARRRNMKEAGYFYELNTPLLTYLVTALRMQAEQAPAWAPKQRERLLQSAESICTQALSVSRKFRLNLAHALRESAILAAMAGKERAAFDHIEQSIATAEAMGQRYELAQSRVVRAQMSHELGWPSSERALHAAREHLEELRHGVDDAGGRDTRLEESATPSVVDRFETIVASGRAIATALSRDEVHARVHHAALLLLRAERCLVLARSTDASDLTPRYGDMGLPYSEALVRRTLEADRVVVLTWSEAQRDPIVQRSRARSVMTVPIRARGRAQGCLYVVHTEVDCLFGDDEVHIAEYLAALAGAALENAANFARLETLSRELEARVADRTRELARANVELAASLQQVEDTQVQLVQAGKMAALGTMIAGLSHEINNPLAAILGFAQVLLRRTPEDDPSRAPLLAIERQTQRCRSLTQGLLAFARTKPRSPAPTDAAALCSGVVDLVAAEARSKEIAIEQHVSSDLPPILVSPQEIESVILNLLSNALDASPSGSSIEIVARPRRRDGVAGVLFTVSDTGSGIPEDVLPRIFDPFFTTKPQGQGTGLGLALAHQAVTAHGGRIEVQSSRGRGTTMSVWLPIEPS